MIESRCGIVCSECKYKEQVGCKGCVNIDKPFWGKSCKVKKCCEERNHEHCGECINMSVNNGCKKLTDMAYDKEQGDEGKRIEQCKIWRGDGKTIAEQLAYKRLDYISSTDKNFIVEFDKEMRRLGFIHGKNIKISPIAFWGKHMVSYSKDGLDEKVVARIYIHNDHICIRMFLTNIDKHRAYIENSPTHIKEVFTNDYAKCRGCKGYQSKNCKYSKQYAIDGRHIQKCRDYCFIFNKPIIEKMQDYTGLLAIFNNKK
jgi:hypothetical protein